MAFPFTITYSKSLDKILSVEEIESILQYVEKYIENKDGEHINIQNNELTYKAMPPGMRRGRRNYFEPANKGKFKILDSIYKSVLVYQISMHRFIVTVFILSVISAVLAETIWVGITSFIFFCAAGRLLAVIQHKSMFKEIVMGINNILITIANA